MTKRHVLAGGTLILAVAVAVALWVPGDADEATRTADPLVQPVAQPGMVTHIDPATGERVAAPVDGVTPQLGPSVDTSDEGLVEKPSPVPGGGMMIELDGRFQNAAVVRTGEDSATAVCEPAGQLDGRQGGER